MVIPALNEAENLPHVLATLPADTYELVLVDGHSIDGTSTVAREHYPTVRIVGQPGRGKGDALRAGFAACSGDVIVMMDADGSTDGAEIERFVAALVDGADYAKGSRFMAGGGSEDITLLRRAGNLGLRVAEVPSVEHLRIHGKSNLHPVRDGLRVLRAILRERERRPRTVDIVAEVEMVGADIEMVSTDGLGGV